jgi:hypothetical protein
MISCNQKRIVFVGDYGEWSSKWFDLDDRDNDKYGRNIFGRLKNEKDDKIFGTKRDKFTRVIDSSEFVVRCSKFRTQYGGGQASQRFGIKIDAIVAEPHSITKAHKIRSHNITSKGMGLESLHGKYVNPIDLGSEEVMFDLVKTHGFKSYRQNEVKERQTSVMDSQGVRGFQLYSNSLHSRLKASELWIPVSRTMTAFAKILFGDDCTRNMPPFLNNELENINYQRGHTLVKNIKKIISKYTEYLPKNIKLFDSSGVLRFRNYIDKYWLSFEEMESRWSNAKWWSDTKERRLDADPVRMHGFKELVFGSRSSLHMNRGVEAIGLAMSDKRFQGYDFYIIGYWGLDQQFSHNIYSNSQIPEYRMLTDLINSGRVKYLPEHIDILNEELDNKIEDYNMPIYFT